MSDGVRGLVKRWSLAEGHHTEGALLHPRRRLHKLTVQVSRALDLHLHLHLRGVGLLVVPGRPVVIDLNLARVSRWPAAAMVGAHCRDHLSLS